MSLNATHSLKPKQGECEGQCGKVTEIHFLQSTGMWLCKDEYDSEYALVQSSLRRTVIHAKEIDQSIRIVPEIMLAKTTALQSVKAAMFADDSIPTDQKQYAYTKYIDDHVTQFKSALEAKRAEVQDLEQSLRLYQAQGQGEASKLSEKLQKEFTQFSIDYSPKPITATQKSTSPAKPKVSGEAKPRVRKHSFDSDLAYKVASEHKMDDAMRAKFITLVQMKISTTVDTPTAIKQVLDFIL